MAGRPDIVCRAGIHSPADRTMLPNAPNVVPTTVDLRSEASIEAALKGVDKVFLVTPLFMDREVDATKRLIDAAAAGGVTHIVRISHFWAEHEPGISWGRWHREAELDVQAIGVPWTILRLIPLMDIFIKYSPPDREGVIYLPLGEGRVAYVDARDVGASAAAALLSDSHEGTIHLLSGPEALTVSDVAGAIGQATGRSIRYVDVPEEAARGAMAEKGVPPWMIDSFVEAYSIMRDGLAGTATDAVQELTGTAPRSFAEFARDRSDAWTS